MVRNNSFFNKAFSRFHLPFPYFIKTRKATKYNTASSPPLTKGLKALKASGPKGMQAYKKITGKNA